MQGHLLAPKHCATLALTGRTTGAAQKTAQKWWNWIIGAVLRACAKRCFQFKYCAERREKIIINNFPDLTTLMQIIYEKTIITTNIVFIHRYIYPKIFWSI